MTSFYQPPRDPYSVSTREIERFLVTIQDLSTRYDMPPETVIEAIKVLEMRRSNDAYVENGNNFDSHIQGIGELLQSLERSIDSIADKLG